ncbi:bpX6 domain-containing protein [Pseudomonas syringae]|nr:hypothetical protein [Pseudomonas syringae]
MPEHDATLIHRPALTGQQQVEGLWWPAERFTEQQCARLIVQHWQTGARAFRFADGHLLYWRQPLWLHCDTLAGWPLIGQGRGLCSAPLTEQERAHLPTADLWLVRGNQVSALHLRDATTLAPGDWLAISDYPLHETFDCRSTLPDPELEPLGIASDLRDILGDAVGPASPEREGVMQALQARQRPAPDSRPSAQSAPAAHRDPWRAPSGPYPDWLKMAVFLGLVMLISALAAQFDQARPSGSVSIGAVLIGLLIGAVLFTLLLMGIRKLLRQRDVPVRQGGAPGSAKASLHARQHAAQQAAANDPAPSGNTPSGNAAPALAPRARQGWHKPATWRRWLTRLTRHSRLSGLYGKRQAAYVQRMLAMFEDGDLQEALRHAIPIGSGQGATEQSFGTPQRRDELKLSQHTGPGRAMLFEEDMEAHLKQLYRQAFERLDREGRVEEAVFVLAELLKVRQEALDYLEKHGRHQQAAELALGWDMPAAMIVRLLCLAGDWQRALLVARRDDAFAEAVPMLQGKWPEQADRLRLEWAQALTGKGLWLQAVDVIWSLPEERPRAAQWLLDAEAAGGRLAIGALVKRAILLPDTLASYGAWVEQLRDDPQRYAERAALAEALLQHQDQQAALAWLSGATVHAILADQSCGHTRLTQSQLQTLMKMSQDPLLQADLPARLLMPAARMSLDKVTDTQEWTAPHAGSRAILDAAVLDDGRYLLALGEAGAAVIDATGKTLFHFAVPAQELVIAHSRQVALALARHDGVWRISKLDLVNRTAKDLGVLMFSVHARSFDGTAWTIGRDKQVRVVDVDHGFATLWHVSDLPGRIICLREDTKHEHWWLYNSDGDNQFWHYTLPERRLTRREPMPARIHEDSDQVFCFDGQFLEYRLKHVDTGAPILLLEEGHDRKGYRLPDLDETSAEHDSDAILLKASTHWLLVAYVNGDRQSAWHVIHRDSDRLCARLQWPQHDLYEVTVRNSGDDWLLFDGEGRFTHFKIDEGCQRNLSIN